MQGVVEEMVV